MGKNMTIYKEVDVEFEISFGDVMEYIEYYANDLELKEIATAIAPYSIIDDRRIDGSYIREEKDILLSLAKNKYTLEELEKRLGNKFDLI